MTAPRYIEHLVLVSGTKRHSYRSDQPPEVLAKLRPALDRASRGIGVERVPGYRGLAIEGARTRGRGILLHVSSLVASEPRWWGTFGIAPTSLASAEMWRMLGCAEDDQRRPAAPWCVEVQLHTSLVCCPDLLLWMRDLQEQCAWAWLG